MGLKADRWIRQMALEQGMIEPFVERQVREGVISFGLSSYGYDMRVADEFRIFTNVYNTVVDPKNFSPDSMVEFQGDICIIPPNSFALARSIEYFRVPRGVLAVCLGKSTYARCFRGDTRVALVDGRALTLEDMARRAGDGEIFFGYSIGAFGRVIVTELQQPRYIGRDALVEVELDDGATIQCTPDHEFITRGGELRQACALRPGDALMPLHRQLARGYEMVYQPLNGQLHPTHRLADEWNVRCGMYPDQDGTHRHHLDFDRRNNNPWNIARVPAREHIRLHNAETYGEEFDREAHGRAVQEKIKLLWDTDPEWREHFSQSQRRKTLSFWHDEAHAAKRAALLEARPGLWDEEYRQAARERVQRYYADPAHRDAAGRHSKAMWEQATDERRDQQREIARRINLRDEITAERVRAALDESGSIRGAARLLDCDRAVFRRFPEVIDAFRGARTKYRYRNHKVASVRDLAGDHDVYCLSVPEAGNFGLEAGVFVRNCGIITNVTPFEPEWEGHVTIEISNTTPLPAKVYANEGISQVLFFEGDEVCEVSYADRKGKYQGQRGVTPPRL